MRRDLYGAAVASLVFAGCMGPANPDASDSDEPNDALSGEGASAAASKIPPSVRITSPGEDLATNAATIVVTVEFASVREIDLLMNGARVATGTARGNTKAGSTDFSVSLAGLPDQVLTFQAEGYQNGRSRSRADSAPVHVLLDRTPPKVAGRVPAPAATNVWSRDPIQVVFDEPVASVPASAVALSDASGAVAHGVSLSADGRTLTVAPDALPPAPSTLTLTLASGITDRAGNALELPADPQWSWELPAWQTLGSFVSAVYGGPYYHLCLDRAGDPVAAYLDLMHVKGPWRWTGTQWSELGYPPSFMPPYPSSVSMGAFDSAAMAWVNQYDQYVALASVHADGSWSPAAELNVDPATAAWRPKVLADPSGAHVVAWSEGASIFVRRWDGQAWQLLGPGLGTAPSTEPRLSFDGAGHPVVTTGGDGSWRSSVLAGGAWTSFASCSVPGATDHRVSADGTGFAITGSYVYRCEAGTGAVGVVGDAVSPYALELAPSGTPVVISSEAGGVHVKRWTGTAWESLGGDLTEGMIYPLGAYLAVGVDGVIAVGVDEGSYPDTSELHVLRSNR